MTYSPNPANISWNVSLAKLTDVFAKWRIVQGWSWQCPASNAPSRGSRHWSQSGGSPEQVGVTIRFTRKDEPERSITVNRFGTAADNLWALTKGLDEIRLNELRGLDGVARAFYPMLPAPAVARDPYEVLGVRPDAPWAVVEASYRALARSAHPDAPGGTDDAFKAITAAYERVRAEAKKGGPR